MPSSKRCASFWQGNRWQSLDDDQSWSSHSRTLRVFALLASDAAIQVRFSSVDDTFTPYHQACMAKDYEHTHQKCGPYQTRTTHQHLVLCSHSSAAQASSDETIAEVSSTPTHPGDHTAKRFCVLPLPTLDAARQVRFYSQTTPLHHADGLK
jgi:hypothetical protein